MGTIPWQHYLSTIIDLVLPRSCVGCGTGGAYLCAVCAQAIPAAPPSTTAIQSLWAYRDERVKKLVRLLKYRGGHAIAQDLGIFLYQGWRGQNNPGRWLVTGTPLSRERLKSRRYNQSAKLAQALVACAPDTLEYRDDLLQKIRHTAPQVQAASREARLQNLQEAFAVPEPRQVRGKKILIIDDVTTTGATISECGKVLLEAGARTVRGLTLARG